jgi:hypothetical protein
MANMRIYVYVSEQDSDVLAFTSDESGLSLPHHLGPWRREQTQGDAVAISTGNDPITRAIIRDGFFIATDRSAQ